MLLVPIPAYVSQRYGYYHRVSSIGNSRTTRISLYMIFNLHSKWSVGVHFPLRSIDADMSCNSGAPVFRLGGALRRMDGRKSARKHTVPIICPSDTKVLRLYFPMQY